ncbi:MAG: hypothetical protein ACOYN2_02535 [Patescibacteria group bacterium]
MSQKKLFFFIGIAVLALAIGIGFTLMANSKSQQKGPKGPKEISMWVVGDDSTGFDDIIKAFKKDSYKDTNVVVTKFATYGDYEKSLLNVIADGNSPDIFVVPSSGAGILETKTANLPDSAVNIDDMARNYNKLFDDLIVTESGKSADGKEIQIRSIK